jgi:hypothetical protein
MDLSNKKEWYSYVCGIFTGGGAVSLISYLIAHMKWVG